MASIEVTETFCNVEVTETFRKEAVNGIPISVLKSAIQKYVRRGMLEDGLRVLGLLSYFTETRITTNITNRLVVMMSEEVNIHETFLPVEMRRLHEMFLKTRDPAIWLRMFTILCSARKCRVVSDVKTRWNLPPYKGDVARLDALHEELLRLNGIAPELDPPATIEEFRARLLRGSENVFAVLRVLLRDGKSDGKSDGKITRGTEKAIWDTLEQACGDTKGASSNRELQPSISALRHFHKQMHHAERPIYIYHAVLLLLNASALDYSHTDGSCTIDGDMAMWRREGAEKLALASFPDYVIDRHTSVARGQSAVVFAQVGALIPNEDKRFLSEENRRLYMAFKVLQEGK
jgi:hypothetical protein